MLITECAHGFPKPANCTDCMADGPVAPPTPPRPPSPTVTARTTAQYPGWCAGCGDAIRPGDEIARMSDRTYRHDDPSCTEET